MNSGQSALDGLLKDEMTVPYIEYVCSRLDGKRLRHSVETARLAAELAGRNGESPSRATVAGLVHDIARPFSDDELLERRATLCGVTELERAHPKLLHGIVSAQIARDEMGCADEEVLFAVRHHTCGHPDFGVLGKCLMAADYAELSRDFEAVRKIREELTLDIDSVLLKILDNKIQYLEGLGLTVDERTRALRDVVRRRAAGQTAD